MKVNNLLMFSILLLPIVLYGWEYQYNGPASGPDSARTLVYGDDGNIYVAGTSTGSGSGYDFTVISLTTMGDTNWIYRYNGAGNVNDYAKTVAYGADGNIYAGGYCTESGTNYDFTVISLNSAGDTNWTYQYDGPINSFDGVYSIVYGDDGNIYATGISDGGPTFYKYDIFVASLTNTGTERWTYRYNRSGASNLNDQSFSVAYGDGNVYVAGYAEEVGVSRDFTVISLEAETGDTNWIRCYNGTNNSIDEARSIDYGDDGNIYAAGYINNVGTYQDFAVISYDVNGDTNWTYQYNGSANSTDGAFSIDYGNDGNIYAAGYIRGSNQADFAVFSLTNMGDTNWTYQCNGSSNGSDQANSVTYGTDGNIYAAGYITNTGTSTDYTLVSLTADGDTNWTYIYDGSASSGDKASAIVYGSNGGVYATGFSRGTSTGADIFVTGMKPGIHDVCPFSIDIPQMVYLDTIVTPKSTIKNYGGHLESFDVVCQISPGDYIDTVLIPDLDASDSIQIAFSPDFQFTEIGDYTVTVYTLLISDEEPTNDTLEKIIEVANIDVCPLSIDMPDTILQDTTFNPKATVKNLGTDIETFPVRCTIEPGGYIKTQTVNNLEPGDSIQVTFTTQFTFESDIYTVTVFTMHGDDRNPDNDTLVKVVFSHPGVAEDGSVPILFSFGLQNNPAKGRALFNLALPEDGLVTLKIYDIIGRLASNLSDHRYAGYYQIPWKSKVNGVYFYTFESPGHKEIGKLVIVK